MYSKDSANLAQENFTTEALAIAIEDEPNPMITALCRLDPGAAAGIGLATAAGYRPRTQVSLPGGGRLDLAIEVLDEHGKVQAEVWVEIKIAAPESGRQLDAYEALSRGRGHPVWLVTLAPTRIRDTIKNLTWVELYQAARHPRAMQSTWRDLLSFLEEQYVANDALGPISDREAASLEPAHDLMLKVCAVIVAVHRRLPDVFPPPNSE